VRVDEVASVEAPLEDEELSVRLVEGHKGVLVSG